MVSKFLISVLRGWFFPEKDAPKVDFEEKPEEANKVEEEAASGLTEYPVIGAEDLKK